MTRRGTLILAGIFVLGFLLLWVGNCGYRKVESLQSIEKAGAEMRRRHPGASWIRPEALTFHQKMGESVLLADIRGEEEFAMSHLPGARRFGGAKEIEDAVEAMDAAPELVVVYGSLGFRSAPIAERLRGRIDAEVLHLEGGIFAWANAGRPLVGADGEPADRVHPYNRMWGRLLDEERRAVIEE